MINEGTRVMLDENKIQIENDEEWLWLAEYFVQFFNSPVWTIPVDTYMEENCITFEDVEENPMEHNDVHKNFVAMCEGMIEEKMLEIGITKETFAKAVFVGLAVPEYEPYFQMLFVLDKFLVFKKSMVKKNIDLNNEAMQALADQGVEFSDQDYEYQNLESEKYGLDYALAMSKAHEEEMQKVQQEEEMMLMEAIRLSQQSYEMEQKKAEAPAPVEITPDAPVTQVISQVQKPTATPVQAPAPQPVREMPVPATVDHPLLKKLQEEREVNKGFIKQAPQAVRANPSTSTGLGLGALPALNTKGGLGFARPKLPEIEKRKEEIEKKLVQMKQSDPAAMEERKRKLLEQRKILLEKKRKEREANLIQYEKLENSKKQGGISDDTRNKRKAIYSMLRR